MGRALAERIVEQPVCAGTADHGPEIEALAAQGGFALEGAARGLLAGLLEGSPYLSSLARRDPVMLGRCLTHDPDAQFDRLTAKLGDDIAAATTLPEAMKALRVYKTEVALLCALADLSGVWEVMRVTQVLSLTAENALQAAVRFLFTQATAKGDWLPPDPARPEHGSGYIVLGMGKFGAYELNYSSDIDLIVFYEARLHRWREGLETQASFVRLTRDLVRLMQERTVDGYVFRTDLRLRPDAGATQIALSADAALHYYEAFGQNWERAALIKARPVAGDLEAGEALLGDLAPFIWRKYLDFAAIADIHAMKRQIHAFRGLGDIGVAGHNLKLGRGGIREIEFFVQTQQLIAGGRQKDLRLRATLSALRQLVARGWIKDNVARDLDEAYRFLRRAEHRVQMVADEQTHELPSDPAPLAAFARFAGFADLEAFSAALVKRLETVQKHYSALFEDMPELTAGGVNMVFAGEQDDPDTVAALAKMGFSQPSQVLAIVRGWHHGRYPAVRSPRSRERLTEVQPLLISALADTADPDRALASFDRFLCELPTGVQLFSLLRANPGLLRLVADIMGTAPRLAGILSRRRRLLDAVLDPRTFGELPAAEEIARLVSSELAQASDMQDVLDRARVVGSEQAFLIGVRVLSGSINASQAGGAYALVAELLIGALQREVARELERQHGKVRGGDAAVIAMGKLGGCEMTASSDLDLIVIYDFAPDAVQTDGLKPLAPAQFYSRLTQRLIAALSAPTAEGTLYDVDLRLRPSGQKGPVATQLSSFVEYQKNEAWTWEHLALTRARVLTGSPRLADQVRAAIRGALVAPRDPVKLAADVRDMRKRIAAEKGTDKIWDLKQVRGGLVDLEFIAQFLQLRHAAAHPEVLDQNTIAAFQKLTASGLLAQSDAEVLIPAARLVHNLTQILRLCLEGKFEPDAAPRGLKDLLARAGDAPSFAALEARLRQTLEEVHAIYERLVV
jgi:glutamate-ammonia-ligase adenylyltransferase